MGFTFHKLYPSSLYGTVNPPAPVDCCDVVCECVIDQSIGGNGSGVQPSSGVCVCPFVEQPLFQNGECTGDPPACGVCRFGVVFTTTWSFAIGTQWWDGGWLNVIRAICITPDQVLCECSDPFDGGGGIFFPPPPCIEPSPDPCCQTDLICESNPYGGGGGIIPHFDQCVVAGASPHTYKIEDLGFIGHRCRAPNMPKLPIYLLEGESDNASVTGTIGDPNFARDLNAFTFPYMAYHKTPDVASGVTTVDFSRYCLKLHKTDSHEKNIPNRLMVVSGRNVYNYYGALSGDPRVPETDPLWNDPGASGLSQLEGFLGKPFPLPDFYSRLPLWGEMGGSGTDNLGIDVGGEICPPDTLREGFPRYDGVYVSQCCDYSPDGLSPPQCGVCVSCQCLRSNPDSAVGHYLSNSIGHTAGYFSFSCFNPHAYLDSMETQTIESQQVSVPQQAGFNNGLGFGSIGSFTQYRFGCDLENSQGSQAEDCVGFKGATAHGKRLGYPSCSVWSMIKATYSRVRKALSTSEGLYNLFGGGEDLYDSGYYFWNENWFRRRFPTFSSAIDTALSDDPSGTINGTSKVHYHLAKISEALTVDSVAFFSSGNYGVNTSTTSYLFTPPNVFLWDPVKYKAASGAEKWKHLYIIGNGNVIFDSALFALPDGYSSEETDLQEFRSFVFNLDEVNHQNLSTITEDTAQARILLFNGAAIDTSIATLNDRIQATTKISMTQLPVCSGVTSQRYPDLEIGGLPPITICEVCNAWPNEVCLTGTTPSCGTVNGLDQNGNLCMYPSGHIFESNCLTASYQI